MEEDRVAGSAGSSTGSSAASPVSDPGPAFDPKKAPPAPQVDEPEVLFEEWDEQRIREFLKLKGELLHVFLSAGPEDQETWFYTDRDLKTIAPPLTRILNRYDATRAAAAAGDEILLASGLARYASRNYIRRRRYLAAQQPDEPQPVTGVEAPEGTGPEDDPDWVRTHDPLAVVPPALTPKGKRR